MVANHTEILAQPIRFHLEYIWADPNRRFIPDSLIFALSNLLIYTFFVII